MTFFLEWGEFIDSKIDQNVASNGMFFLLFEVNL